PKSDWMPSGLSHRPEATGPPVRPPRAKYPPDRHGTPGGRVARRRVGLSRRQDDYSPAPAPGHDRTKPIVAQAVPKYLIGPRELAGPGPFGSAGRELMGHEPSDCCVLLRKACARRTAFSPPSVFCPLNTYRDRPVAKASLFIFFN